MFSLLVTLMSILLYSATLNYVCLSPLAWKVVFLKGDNSKYVFRIIINIT